MEDYFSLYDYRQKVFAMNKKRNLTLLYMQDPKSVCEDFRKEKDELFKSHSQSPLDADQKKEFSGLKYFDYNPDAVVTASINREVSHDLIEVPKDANQTMHMMRAAELDFTFRENTLKLNLYWIDIYGGGFLLPYHDLSSPEKSYGAGKYLFDTIKGNDLFGLDKDKMILDFNYSYNPSCAYNPQWVCPLAPRENYIDVEIDAGELKYHD